MKEYWIRSSIVGITFLDLCVTGISVMSHPTFLNIIWTSYFLVLLGLIVSHKKHNMHKAILNFLILLMVAIPVAGLGIPVALIFRGLEFSAAKGNLYILISLISLVYLAIRHEKMSIPETASKIAIYVGELRTTKLRSSFGTYVVSEISIMIIIAAFGIIFLLK